MSLSGLCWQTPLVIVWIAGIVLAISRWQRHPRVSAAVVIGIACMLSASVSRQLLYSLLLPALIRNYADVTIYLQIFAAIDTLIRTAGWATMFLAIFGWREASAASSGKSMLQFSIRGLLVTTFVVAVLCGLLRGLVAALGESAAFLLAFLGEIPIVICWLAGGSLAWMRWTQHPKVSICALGAIGFQVGGLILINALGVWILTRGGGPSQLWPLVSLSWLLANTASWVMLLRAAFGWRTTRSDQPVELPPETET